jgi:hypothetical protein
MEVSPDNSDRSVKNQFKEELKESLRQDNFFINNAAKTEDPKIKLQIGDGNQSTVNQLVGTISPLSGASSDFGIQRGGMSLESSLSGETAQRAIKDANHTTLTP